MMLALALLLTFAVLLAWLRLALWQARAAPRAARWRMALLIALQPLCAGLLYLTLVPPPLVVTAGTLVIATAGAPRLTALAATDTILALPEAPDLPGAERMPDLATALRRHPDTARLRIIGQGLAPRDRPAVAGLPLSFDPAPLPRGLIALILPPQTAPGAGFRVSGAVNEVPGGRAELIDPAGQTTAVTALTPQGSFVLTGTSRIAGPADFALRIRDARGRLVETAAVPLITAVQPPPRILVVAGSAGPDLKYLRRWASDAGIDLKASIAAGSGLDIGDAPPRLDATSLAALDLLILDERSWASLTPGQRTSILAATRSGLGLMLRVTGPVPDAVRRAWAALGLPLGDTGVPFKLAATSPELTRAALIAAPGALPLLIDSANTPVALWRSSARGRIGLWPVPNLYSLVLAGEPARHAAVWSEMFGILARANSGAAPRSTPIGTIGQRLSLCSVALPTGVVQPDGQRIELIPDRAAADCAAVWPRQAGWHKLADGSPAFFVTSVGAARTTVDARLATWQLTRTAPGTPAAGRRPGTSWPWYAALLVSLALLWWLERARFGQRASNTAD